VLIYVHKERELADVERFYPARRYVMVDDKLRVLNAVKKVWGERVTTIFLRQGHYARDPQFLAGCPPADIQLDYLGDLNNYALAAFRSEAARVTAGTDKPKRSEALARDKSTVAKPCRP
jgi:hypothetical protein